VGEISSILAFNAHIDRRTEQQAQRRCAVAFFYRFIVLTNSSIV